MIQRIAIAIHDVAPSTLPACQTLTSLIEQVAGQAVPVTLLVVPHYHRQRRIDACAAFRRWIDARCARGDEVALHGLWHLDEGPPVDSLRSWWQRRVMTNREGEFAALTRTQARSRIDHGLTLLAKCGWSTCGFVPPAWQISASARELLRDYGFGYTADRQGLLALAPNEQLHAPALSLSVRSAPRRWLSERWCNHWLRAHRESAAVRIALHPADAAFEPSRTLWRACLSELLENRVAQTKSTLMRECMRTPVTEPPATDRSQLIAPAA